jgi:methylthioribose-1-phosphate isomerase
VIRASVEQGKQVVVFADETRPFLQGARLTAWELVRDGIQTTVITDNMSGALMRQGQVDLVVVGADRIAANGDTANKIGTYSVAVLAREHKIPFYVAAPLSTIDLNTPDGDHIPIEERNAREVTHVGPSQVVPEGARVWNPAFDVTPHRFIAGIITERGIFRPPYTESLKSAFEEKALA